MLQQIPQVENGHKTNTFEHSQHPCTVHWLVCNETQRVRSISTRYLKPWGPAAHFCYSTDRLFPACSIGDSQQFYKSYLFSSGAAGQLMTWFNELFPKAFDCALSHPWAVPTTRHGLLMGVLSHLAMGVPSRRSFLVALARGLGSGMEPSVRQEFAMELTK